MTEENEKKTLFNNLLIQINIKIWLLWIVYFLLVFTLYFSMSYLNVLKNSVSEIFKVNYMFYSFRSNFLKLKKQSHLIDVLIDIKGLTVNDLELLRKRTFSRGDHYFREIVFDQLSSESEDGSYGLLLKASLSGSNSTIPVQNLRDPIESHFESYMESLNITELQSTQPSYSVFVSFSNCGRRTNLENTINVYNGRISLFCLSNEMSKSDFFIILNDLFDVWFLKFTENEPEITKYSSLQIYMNNLFDLDMDYTNLPNLKESQSYSEFENFVSQINQLLYVNIKMQNKYISKGSVDLQDMQKTYYRIIHNFNSNNYNYHDRNTLVLQVFNYFSNFTTANDNGDSYFINTSRDFLLIHSNMSNKTDIEILPAKVLIHVIRSLVLPKDYKLNFKSRLNNVTFKNHIKEENQNLYLSEWQISAIQLIHYNHMLNKTLFNIGRFFSTIGIYNIMKLPHNIIYAAEHINNIISNIHMVSHNYLPTILQNSNDLLFNSGLHNKKTFNPDLIMAIYSPISVPILFIIIISFFRIVKHSKMKFE